MTTASPPAVASAPLATRRTFAGLDGVTWVALGLLIVAGLLYTLQLTAFLNTDDEESYLYQAWRVSLGELPYRDFLTPQLPGFLGLGGLAMRLAGPSALTARLLSVGMILLAGWFVYLIGRRLYRPWIGVGALALFLAYPRVVDMARLYRPESFMLAMQVAGLYTFIVAHERRSRWGMLGAGILFGLAVLMKLFGALTLVGLLLFLAYEGVRRLRPWREVIRDGALVGGAAAVTVLGVMGIFMLIAPQTYAAVLGHHLMQGSGLSRWETAEKGAAFLVDYFWEYAPALVLALFGAGFALRDRSLRAVLAWQLPTALAFLLLSRELYLRHTVYLAPVVCLLAVGLLDPLLDPTRGARWGRPIALAVVLSLLVPWTRDSVRDNRTVDDTTWRLIAYLDAVVPPGVPLLADNSGVNFYTQRPTTPTAASLSKGATDSGQIRAAGLLPEMQQSDISWVLLETDGPGQTLNRLHDRDAFLQVLEARYERVGTIARERQTHTLYRKKGVASAVAPVAVGPLRATLLDAPPAASGAAAVVTLALQAPGKLEPGQTGQLVVSDEQGRDVAAAPIDLDTFGGPHARGWTAGDVRIGRVDVPLPPGTPAGDLPLSLQVAGKDGQALGRATVGTLRVAQGR